MPDETHSSSVPPPDIRVAGSNGTLRAQADYPFYGVIQDESHSLQIELVEDPEKRETPYYNIDFTIQAELSGDEQDPLLAFTCLDDDGNELPPGIHVLKWTSEKAGLLLSDGQNLSVQTPGARGIIAGDSTGCGWVPPAAGNASFGWKSGRGWSWFKPGESTLTILTAPPSGGYGPAVCRTIAMSANGSWTVTGPECPVIVPNI